MKMSEYETLKAKCDGYKADHVWQHNSGVIEITLSNNVKRDHKDRLLSCDKIFIKLDSKYGLSDFNIQFSRESYEYDWSLVDSSEKKYSEVKAFNKTNVTYLRMNKSQYNKIKEALLKEYKNAY